MSQRDLFPSLLVTVTLCVGCVPDHVELVNGAGGDEGSTTPRLQAAGGAGSTPNRIEGSAASGISPDGAAGSGGSMDAGVSDAGSAERPDVPVCSFRDTQPCGPETVGICVRGTQFCVNGAFGACTGAVFPEPPNCDSPEDNDCDGVPDNAGIGAACTASGSGACAQGITVCSGGSILCTPAATRVEVCNGEDDDCDGQTDELGATTCEHGRCLASGACDCSGTNFIGARCETGLVTQLEVTISTGDDNLNGASTATFFAILNDGRTVSGPIDGTDELPTNSTRVFRIPIQPAVELATIETIGVSADLPDDSWNVEALSVEALTEVDGDFILSRFGDPLVRLTEVMPQITFPAALLGSPGD